MCEVCPLCINESRPYRYECHTLFYSRTYLKNIDIQEMSLQYDRKKTQQIIYLSL